MKVDNTDEIKMKCDTIVTGNKNRMRNLRIKK